MVPLFGIILRAVLLLLATSEVVAIADEAFCAEIVSDSSSAYKQSSDDWHFSFTFKVHRWVPKMHVSIDFGEPVEIFQVSGGASEVDQYYYGQGGAARPGTAHCPNAHTLRVPLLAVDANFVVVELDEGIHNFDSEFVMMGSGTSNTSPEITCTCACLLPHCGCWPSAHSARLPDALQGERGATTCSAAPVGLHYRSTLHHTASFASTPGGRGALHLAPTLCGLCLPCSRGCFQRARS